MRGFLLFCLIGLAGCGQSQTLPEEVVAKVNDYRITVEDFKRELVSSWPILKNYPNIPPAEMKAKILEAMITNQLLLEEAQKLNADKEPAFRHEVENYWRQALLKTLIQRKNAEFLSGNAAADKDEELKETLLQDKMDQWIGELKAQAHILSDKQVLDKIELNAAQLEGERHEP